jgi:hypothetical protein
MLASNQRPQVGCGCTAVRRATGLPDPTSLPPRRPSCAAGTTPAVKSLGGVRGPRVHAPVRTRPRRLRRVLGASRARHARPRNGLLPLRGTGGTAVTGTRRRGLDQSPLEGQDGHVPGDADPTGEQWVKPSLPHSGRKSCLSTSRISSPSNRAFWEGLEMAQYSWS